MKRDINFQELLVAIMYLPDDCFAGWLDHFVKGLLSFLFMCVSHMIALLDAFAG